MEHLVIKIVVIFCLLCLTLLAALLPFKIGHAGHGGRRQLILSYCNCFAGGVFLATSLLDLLPMIEEKFKAVFNESGIVTVFPVAEFTTCMGFFMVLLLEQIVHTFHERSFLHSHNHEVKAPLLEEQNEQRNRYMHSESNDAFSTRQTSCDSQKEILLKKEQQTEGSIRTYILVLALSMHSIFEGLALGLIVEVDRLIQITIAVIIHKSIIAFAMGVSMVQHKMAFGTVLKAAIIFSMMAPIGIGVGIGVLDSSSLKSSNLASGILQGIANGTFIFVTFFEILQSELARKGNRLLKVFFMIIGYSVVTGLLYYANIMESKSHPVSAKNSTSPSINIPEGVV
ncbi:zinc transporter ZIP3 [Exaiptasia diaphana]|uniref:Uncharacterized protein n=1 Tax=Exaiptasia diaphana TaxID=2652724 RepID=A0A913X4L4_EXADI|nr:zinc transporter ZIP3 [Exaiptasia diaphana]KXJ27243.1 Zinc transporter ZIP3 [Exaiptasia diaphana]